MSMVDLSTPSNKTETIEPSGRLALRLTLLMTVLHQYAVRVTTWPWLSVILVGLALLSAILSPLNLLSSQRFHHDEALYATWALEIVSGHNPLLKQTPIDKPPLFIYTVAGAMDWLGQTETVARLPSLLATGCVVALTFWLGRLLYSRGVGILGAWLAALSPFTICFAPTVFTDPMLVALVLASCLAAAYGRAGWAGVWLGLAIGVKQQGLFFVPLGLGLLLCARLAQAPAKKQDLIGRPGQASGFTSTISRFGLPVSRFKLPVSRFKLDVLRMLLAMALTILPVFIWDAWRIQEPGYWRQSLANYSQLAPDAASFGRRCSGFVELLQYGAASPILNIIFILGLPLLLLYGYQIHLSHSSTRQAANRRQTQTDWLILLFALAFLLGHALLSFQVWDRYLLGLIPLLALLLARILLLPWSILKDFWLDRRPKLQAPARVITGLALGLLLALTLARPVQDAANARYPLGSNSNALRGVEQITAYLQAHAGADTTLYHRWLGTHWRFYLWGYPYDLQYWASPQVLAAKAQAGHLIAFPTWQSETEARLALAQAGLGLQELSRAYNPAGYPSVILYRVEVK